MRGKETFARLREISPAGVTVCGEDNAQHVASVKAKKEVGLSYGQEKSLSQFSVRVLFYIFVSLSLRWLRSKGDGNPRVSLLSN